MARKALIIFGGWDGHQPKASAEVLAGICRDAGLDAVMSASLEMLMDGAMLALANLLIVNWTMGQISGELAKAVCDAVAGGLGLAGCHGGLCDAFRECTEWQFMTGGQFVGHPGNDGTKYRVNIAAIPDPITQGIAGFNVASEQYYMHVDPAVRVLATTRFPIADGPHASNGPVDMPVIWTKKWGNGRVFYSSLGHSPAMIVAEPHRTLLSRGFAWAAR
jgi:uncharacterized protein